MDSARLLAAVAYDAWVFLVECANHAGQQVLVLLVMLVES
jgi:hypothetical protein